ncbi:UDP-N-acetyl-D-mannosamine dehydrogenase / UDP-glucose 6-dehydrogenase [Acanthocystis turfacea Chlorella virus GM0701.1]|nr:UDP-N-acetyl-D-mannosamine dehydrogenase / UDP-glucose 6-dehydrogenase [Acanthocystis turfacea Chlorella virus GM0701.1]
MSSIMKLGVIGAGYVGLELLQVLSRGYETQECEIVAYDISEERSKYVNSITADNVSASNDPSTLSGCSAFMICVPTPDDANGRPDESCLRAAKELVETYASAGDVIILESSVCIGDTRAIFGDLREKGMYVAFSPERVDPGRSFPAAHTIHKLIGGIDRESLDKALAVYSPAFDNLVPVSSPEVAEFSKLYENTFRLVNIAFANQMADAAKKLGLDPAEIYNAVATKPFGLSGPFTHGLGAGGPCLPSNALHMLHTCDVPLLKNASDVLAERPSNKAYEFFGFATGNHIKKTVVSGLTFKKNVSTLVASPALSFVKQLTQLMDIVVHDPMVDRKYVPELKFTDDLETDLATADCVILLVAHDHPDTDIVKNYTNKMIWTP